MIAPRNTRTHARSECLARMVHELRALGCRQRVIAEFLAISRESVAKYLAPNCKAALRAGVIK